MSRTPSSSRPDRHELAAASDLRGQERHAGEVNAPLREVDEIKAEPFGDRLRALLGRDRPAIDEHLFGALAGIAGGRKD